MTTYLIGFSHDLVPHCHDDDISSHHHHEHQQHDKEIDINHEHLQHGDHIDTSIFDFVVCFFSDLEHTLDNCYFQLYTPTKTNNNLYNEFSFDRFIVALLSVYNIVEPDVAIATYSNEVAFDYTHPPILYAPHRGPPLFSC